MDSQEQAVSEPVVQTIQPEAKKCNHIVVIIILAILAIGGIGFGGFELWQNIKKDDEIKALQAQNGSETNVEGCGLGGNTEITDDNVKEEIVEALKKYRIFVDDNDIQPMYINDFVYRALDDFNKDFKDRYTAYVMLNGDYIPASSNISYKSANDIYHSLFGDVDDLSKKEYNWYCTGLVYDSNEDIFNINHDENCGIGGYTTDRLLYKIDSISNHQNKIAVRLSSVIYNSLWGIDTDLQYQEDPEELIGESLASHVLYFEKYNNSYALIDIE